MDLLSVWLIAILSENIPIKNMKLLMPNVLFDDVVEIPTRLGVNIPIFKIAFADSNSNAKSNPFLLLFSLRHSSSLQQFVYLKMIL